MKATSVVIVYDRYQVVVSREITSVIMAHVG